MRALIISFIFITNLIPLDALANNLGPADFPADIEKHGPRSYHDAWCRQLNKKCRVVFSGRDMTVEGFSGISREQLIGFRKQREKKNRYFYVRYLNRDDVEVTALFLFSNRLASQEFGLALVRWYEQDPRPFKNFIYPNSQGPQETHGRDKGLNPYDNPPITDWKEKTTE